MRIIEDCLIRAHHRHGAAVNLNEEGGPASALTITQRDGVVGLDADGVPCRPKDDGDGQAERFGALPGRCGQTCDQIWSIATIEAAAIANIGTQTDGEVGDGEGVLEEGPASGLVLLRPRHTLALCEAIGLGQETRAGIAEGIDGKGRAATRAIEVVLALGPVEIAPRTALSGDW